MKRFMFRLIAVMCGLLCFPAAGRTFVLVDHNPSHPIAAMDFWVESAPSTTANYYYYAVLLRDGTTCYKECQDRDCDNLPQFWYIEGRNMPVTVEQIQYWGWKMFSTFDGQVYIWDPRNHTWVLSDPLPVQVGTGKSTWSGVKGQYKK